MSEISATVDEYAAVCRELDVINVRRKALMEAKKTHEVAIQTYMDRTGSGELATNKGYAVQLKIKRARSAITKGVYEEYFNAKNIDPVAAYKELKSLCPMTEKKVVTLVTSSE